MYLFFSLQKQNIKTLVAMQQFNVELINKKFHESNIIKHVIYRIICIKKMYKIFSNIQFVKFVMNL